jgi:hypothetical protein
VRLLQPSRLLGRTVGLLGRTTSRLLGKTLAFLAPLALKLGVTRRVLLTLIGVAVVVVLVLILLATGLFG